MKHVNNSLIQVFIFFGYAMLHRMYGLATLFGCGNVFKVSRIYSAYGWVVGSTRRGWVWASFGASMVIWHQRNVVVHGGQLQEPSALNHCDRDVLEEYRQTQTQMLIPNPAVSVEVWCPPPSSRFKLNFDATLFADLDEIRMRAIVQNEKGGDDGIYISQRPFYSW